MIMKHITLAALAATFITAGASLASAESGVGVAGTGSGFTSSALENDWTSETPSVTGHAAYGFAPEHRIGRAHHRAARHHAVMHHHS